LRLKKEKRSNPTLNRRLRKGGVEKRNFLGIMWREKRKLRARFG